MTLKPSLKPVWITPVFWLFLYCAYGAEGPHGAETVPQNSFYYPAILANETPMSIYYGDSVLANWTAAPLGGIIGYQMTLWIGNNGIGGDVYGDASLRQVPVPDVGTKLWATTSQETYNISTSPWPLWCHFQMYGNDNSQFNSWTWTINKPNPDFPHRTWGLYDYGGVLAASATLASTTTPSVPTASITSSQVSSSTGQTTTLLSSATLLPSANPSGADRNSTRSSGNGLSGGVIAGLIIGALAVLILFGLACWYLGRRTMRRRARDKPSPHHEGAPPSYQPNQTMSENSTMPERSELDARSVYELPSKQLWHEMPAETTR